MCIDIWAPQVIYGEGDTKSYHATCDTCGETYGCFETEQECIDECQSAADWVVIIKNNEENEVYCETCGQGKGN